MTLRWYLSTSTGVSLEITDRVRLPLSPEGVAIGVGAHADAGSGWEGDLLVDDTAGDLIPLMFRRVYCLQDAAPAGAQTIGNWFISNLNVVRKDPWNAVSRTWVITMADENSLLSRRKFVGTDSNRPAETDIARLRWALTTTELNVLSPDETYIDTTSPVALDAADLRTQGPDELMSSLMAASGKNYWIKYEEAAAVGGAIVSSSVANPTHITTTTAHGLFTGMTVVIAGHSGSTPSINGSHVVTVLDSTHYTIPVNVTVGGTGGTTTTVGRYVIWYANMNTSTLYSSTVKLSNVASEIGVPESTLVYPLSGDVSFDRAGGRMASGLVAPYKTGWVYVQDTVVGETYAYVDRVAPAPNVSTSAKATAQVTRQLAELDIPDDEVTTTWTVEGDNLNLIMHGMRIQVHGTHFPDFVEQGSGPGYADGYVWFRVMERTIRQLGPTTFDVTLRLSPQAPTFNFLMAAVLVTEAPGSGFFWPDGWTQILDYQATHGFRPNQHIYVAWGPIGANSVQATANSTFGNSNVLVAMEILGASLPHPVLPPAGFTEYATDPDGEAFVLPSTVVSDSALLIALMTRQSSAPAWNDPLSGWSDLLEPIGTTSASLTIPMSGSFSVTTQAGITGTYSPMPIRLYSAANPANFNDAYLTGYSGTTLDFGTGVPNTYGGSGTHTDWVIARRLWDAQPLGDTQLYNVEYRNVAAGTYTGIEAVGPAGDITTISVVVVVPGANVTIGRRGTSGNKAGVGTLVATIS